MAFVYQNKLTASLSSQKKNNINVSELRYRRLFESTQDGRLLIDFKTGMILDVNKYLIDMLGYSKKEFLEKYLWEVGVFKDIADLKENFKILQIKKFIRFDDLSLKTKAGKIINVEFVSNAYDVGDTMFIQCTIRDIRERKTAENLMMEAKYLAEAIIESVKDPLLILDSDMKVVSVNKYFCEFFKTSKEKTLGKYIYDLGNGEWNIPELKRLLNIILPQNVQIKDFIVIHKFKDIGFKTMLLNTREIILETSRTKNILLAIEDITFQKETEGLLSASETKYRKLFDNAKLGLLIIESSTGIIIDANPYLSNLLELPREQFIAKTIWELKNFKEIFPNKKQFIKIREQKYTIFEDISLITFSGKKLNVEFVSDVFEVEKLVIIQCSIRDITLQKKTQKALMESEQNYRLLIESSNDVIICVNRDGTYNFVNNVFASLFNKPREFFIGKPFSEIYSKEYAESRLMLINSVFETGEAQSFELVLPQGDKDLYFAGKASPIKDKTGKTISILIHATDITKRKDIEENLKISEKKWRSLFEILPVGVSVIDSKNNITDFNPALSKVLHISDEALLSGDYKKRKYINSNSTQMYPEEFPNIRAIKEQAIIRDVEIGIEEEDGNVIWTLVNSAPLPDGIEFGSVNIITDITERKRILERLKELDKMKNNFLTVTTHELKAPLVPIKSQLQMLMAGDYGELNPEQKNALDMIYRNEEALDILSSRILEITKIESGQLKIFLESTVLAELIQESYDGLKQVAKQKEIKFKSLLLPELPKIKLDKIRIGQVINNLLENSIKFTPRGGTISMEAMKKGNYIIIKVKDTGIGIARKDMGKLFIPFFQLDNNLNRKYRGSGLGLSISKGIVELHGGKIWAESKGLGKGSTFSFSLPIVI